ncbi:MAG: hypothetical protein CVU86_06680 [Firmicutes bacterium HGW-Firmicutes-11]|nr:MAG: hypothetical protein CVU86_06680 [Firmicutes bacterium HGW-Firmicutes-11]
MERRLYKSRTNRQISGVCGGIGEYFNIDPVIIRLLVVVFTLAGGAGLIAYIIAAIIIPEPDGATSTEVMEDEEDSTSHPAKNSGSGTKVLGIILIVLAALIGIRTLTPWIPGEWIIIAIFLGLGLFFLVKRQ